MLRRPPGVRPRCAHPPAPPAELVWVGGQTHFAPIDFDIKRGASCCVCPYVYLVKEGRALPESGFQGRGVWCGLCSSHCVRRGEDSASHGGGQFPGATRGWALPMGRQSWGGGAVTPNEVTAVPLLRSAQRDAAAGPAP